jgi:hypothetical protein
MIHEYEQQGILASGRFRSAVGAVVSLDFHTFIDDFVANFWGISRCLALSVFFFGLLGILSRMIPNFPLFAFEWLLGTAPVWLPIAAFLSAGKIWIWYVRSSYISRIKPTLFEMKMPREITKSPRAMEAALTYLWIDSGETTFFNTVWQGKVRPFESFEIASFGGEIHFYIWCWASWKDTIQATMYAQYPEIELVEVEDYASKFHYDTKKQNCFCTDWRYEPRNDAYPIRTYVEFELDKDPDEEFKVDPLAQVLERMSTLKPSEQMWIQIVITMCKDVRHKKKGAWWETESRYVGLLKEEVESLRKETVGDLDDPEQAWRKSARVQMYRYTELIKAIDRNMGKLPFNVGMRGVYIADHKDFGASGYTGIRWIWRVLGNPQYMNQLRPRRWHNPFDYPWQDFRNIRKNLQSRRFFDVYRRRGHFYAPWILPHNMMSTEVIATLWHPIGATAAAPGLERIPAKKAEPPGNLPK